MVAESMQMIKIVVQEVEETKRRGKEGGFPPLSEGWRGPCLTMLIILVLGLLDVPN